MCIKLVESCLAKRLTLAVAESCTGGWLGKEITAIPGASAVFKGGVICYADEVKRDLLGVPEPVLQSDGAVSATCAEYMAQGARSLFKSDLALAITGIAGPGGATGLKPVGLVYICVATAERLLCQRALFKGDRESVRQQAVAAAVAMLLKVI
ncbi:MAG: CinA family protein [Kiritimatiellae bacterium]|nr:CinA family protein [Kiritimatiellia bacterium]